MAIHLEEIVENAGMVKEIDEGAMAMLYDNLQRSQYQYPMKSTIRELVSNGIDSNNEKNNALAILEGKANEADHYYTGGNADMDETLAKNAGVYKDSKFDPGYYDKKWLNLSNNKVEVIYQERGPLERDLLIIKDNGVGLGGKRLEGYFKLGFSSKRLAKKPLGKYGLGSKVALSTGVKYYTVLSRYNGQETNWNVYSANIESIIPPFDMASGEKNLQNTTGSGYTYFTRNTDELNSTEIHVEVKKHMKQEIINAVKNQLLYFPTVELSIHHQNGYIEPINVQAEILYEDDQIIISDNDQFSKPHILINGISYGYIDFLELELEAKGGNIGIKVEPQEIEVVPSRESVVWNEITGDTIKRRFKNVVDIASKYVSDQLIEKDFIKWLKLCSSAMSGSFSGSDKQARVMSTLAQIADLQELKPVYPGDDSIKFFNNVKSLMPKAQIVVVKKETVLKGGETLFKISRTKVKTIGEIGDLPIFVKEEDFSYRKDIYLFTLYPQGFAVFQESKFDVNPTISSMLEEESQINRDLKTDKVMELVKLSEGVKAYADVEIPETFSTKEPTAEELAEGDVLTDENGDLKVNAKQRRKLEGKVLAYTTRTYWEDHNEFVLHKMELTQQELEKLDDLEMYYTTQDHEQLLPLVYNITGSDEGISFDQHDKDPRHYKYLRHWLPGSKIRLLKIAKSNEWFFAQNANHITSFFKRYENNTITMSNALVKWNTARIIEQHISKLEFMNNYKSINSKIAEKFQEIKKYHIANYRGLISSNSEMTDSLVSHLDKVTEMQLYISSNPDNKEGVANLALSLFPEDQNAGEITGATGLDLDIYTKLFELVNYAEPIYTMLNMIDKLRNDYHVLSLAEEQMIKSYVNERTE